MNYPYYNPYFAPQVPAQMRPSSMGQVYPEQANAPQTANIGQTQGISAASRPVSSREEAMAVGADFSGAPMIFPDMAHNAVYVKRWDFQTGSAVFTEFVPKNIPPTPSEEEDLRGMVDRLTERLNAMEADIDRLKRKGAKKNDDE